MEMREFLGYVTTEVLNWPHVASVQVRQVPANTFEDYGMDGEVYVVAWGDVRFGCRYAAHEIAFIKDESLLLLRLRGQYNKAFEKRFDVVASIIRGAQP